MIAQSHAYDTIIVMIVGAWGAVALALAWRRGAVVSERRRRLVAASAALGLVLWLPPLIDQLAGRGNLAELATLARDGGTPVQGYPFAIGRLAAYVAPPFAWTDRSPGFFDLVVEPTTAQNIQLVIILAALGGLAGLAVRRSRPHAALLAVTALVALAASTVAAARLPEGTATLSPYNYRHWWITAPFTWFALGWVLLDVVRPWWAGRRWASPGLRAAAATTAVACAVVTSSQVSIDRDRGSTSFGALRHLTPILADEIRERDTDGAVAVGATGPQAFLSIEPGLVAGLILRGIDARVETKERKIFGSHHTVRGRPALRVLVVSGPDQPRPGMQLVATYDTRIDAAKGARNSGIGGGPESVAVYLGPG